MKEKTTFFEVDWHYGPNWQKIRRWRCDNCGESFTDFSDVTGHYNSFNYCPWCGSEVLCWVPGDDDE